MFRSSPFKAFPSPSPLKCSGLSTKPIFVTVISHHCNWHWWIPILPCKVELSPSLKARTVSADISKPKQTIRQGSHCHANENLINLTIFFSGLLPPKLENLVRRKSLSFWLSILYFCFFCLPCACSIYFMSVHSGNGIPLVFVFLRFLSFLRFSFSESWV